MESLKDLTWRCHICGEERPDAKISVFTKPLVIEGKVMTNGSTENIRHCNDKESCREGAKTFSLFKGGKKVRVDVHPQGTIEENLKDIKERQKLSKADLEKAVEILQGCIAKYDQ